MSAARHYSEIRPLAEGGMALVTLAKRDDGREVVVKRIRPPFDHDPDFKRLFDDEGRVAERLDHPRIVSLLERGQDERGAYLVFEYLEGTDLGVVLRKRHEAGEKGLELPEFFAVAIALLDALAAAHQATDEAGDSLQLVHRDVSPGNVLLSTEGEVKLADFGVAQTTLKTQHTIAGEMKGKFAYMAPEQTRGECDGPKTDLFAAGVVLAEALTGKPLFDAPTDADIVHAVRSEKASVQRDDVPAELCALIDSMLCKEACDRPKSAQEVKEQLNEIALSLGLERGHRRHAKALAVRYPRDDIAQKPRRQTQRVMGSPQPEARRPLGFELFALLAVVLIGALVFMVSRIDTDPKKPTVALTDLKRDLTNEPIPSLVKTKVNNDTVISKAIPASIKDGDKSKSAKTVSVQQAPSKTKAKAHKTPQRRRNTQGKVDVALKTKSSTKPPIDAKSLGMGSLSLQSEPWSNVSIDGNKVGHTPIIDFRLPAGVHQVTLSNPHFNISSTLKVKVKSEGKTKRFVDLKKRP